jgi:hypothetical protein
VAVNPGNGRATIQLENQPTRDYGDIVNALLEGPYVPGIASIRIDWSASNDKHHFHDEASSFDADVVFSEAQAWWMAETADAGFVADDISTSHSLFAEVGHERNGVYFPNG